MLEDENGDSINGIRWSVDAAFESDAFSVFLNGDLVEGDVTIAASSDGADPFFGSTTGPVCDEPDDDDDAVSDGDYRIIFIDYEEHSNGTTTFYYRFEVEAGATAPDSWTLELPGCTQVVSATGSWDIINFEGVTTDD
ncbi:MAG: hypothetical protein HC837_07705 [Chloroflexaceae bacterium]|nr:hypothetical protein [Chloroflexaceae bacterium]